MEYFHHCKKFYGKESVRGNRIDHQRPYNLNDCEGWQWLRGLLGLSFEIFSMRCFLANDKGRQKLILFQSVPNTIILDINQCLSLPLFVFLRCGHLNGDSKEMSPIFTQFLDCIWQLMEQFPCAFEFNEKFLLEIHDHVFSCQFENFLGNCQKDQADLR